MEPLVVCEGLIRRSLGINEIRVKESPDVRVLARLPSSEGAHPLLVAGRFGQGRSIAWTSDMGPHWASQAFVDWPGYARLWRQSLVWLTG